MTFFRTGDHITAEEDDRQVGSFDVVETDELVVYNFEADHGAGVRIMSRLIKEFPQRPIRFAIDMTEGWEERLKMYVLLGCQAEAIQMRYE